MGLVGQGSNQELAVQLSRVADRMLKIRDSRAPAPPVVSSLEQRRRPFGSITEAVSMVLGSVGEMRVRDIHAAIEAMLEEPVSPLLGQELPQPEIDGTWAPVRSSRPRALPSAAIAAGRGQVSLGTLAFTLAVSIGAVTSGVEGGV